MTGPEMQEESTGSFFFFFFFKEVMFCRKAYLKFRNKLKTYK